MKIKKTATFCLNTTHIRNDEEADKLKTSIYMGDNQGEAAVITRVDNFYLSDEQAAKIREIHERAAAEIKDILGW